ncbi:uncharacterized protein J7T54_001526 [Emericellopsis cladophorae]|uniref:Rhodanese domain-containing protein n=1 Tax=Emericellopsis cladophorae TaxID=2686198 RepID=A0A9P9XUN2_9HYPO|nr:uncharacterized protein J7T54_001526 [Emericellopsis cladophorae]KAI6778106.1 hypothetical protein J7T54_001526 [Emericellopsis cladophorae]
MEATAKPWHAAYPAPRAVDLRKLTPAQVLDLLRSADAGSSGQAPTLVLVDLRRNDHEGGTIRGSINLPAQSLYPTIPTLYSIFRAAGIRTVIWYCGSSQGRGSRAAGWFADYIAERQGAGMESAILAGGIKAWVAAGGEHLDYMHEYDATKWDQQV